MVSCLLRTKTRSLPACGCLIQRIASGHIILARPWSLSPDVPALPRKRLPDKNLKISQGMPALAPLLESLRPHILCCLLIRLKNTNIRKAAFLTSPASQTWRNLRPQTGQGLASPGSLSLSKSMKVASTRFKPQPLCLTQVTDVALLLLGTADGQGLRSLLWRDYFS